MNPLIHPDRLFPADETRRAIARRLYAAIKDLPIVSPHGHTDPRWYADNEAFADPATLFVVPDHYIFRMLYSQGMKLEDLGIARKDGAQNFSVVDIRLVNASFNGEVKATDDADALLQVGMDARHLTVTRRHHQHIVKTFVQARQFNRIVRTIFFWHQPSFT